MDKKIRRRSLIVLSPRETDHGSCASGGNGGEGGIRTHGEVSPTHAFQACSFSHSDTSPREACVLADGIGGDDRPPAGWSQRGAGRATSGRGQITTKSMLFIPR